MSCDFGLTRRDFLSRALAGAGGLGLYARLSLAAGLAQGGPLAPKPGHLAPRAKRLVVFFFTGGMSHVDTFDYKPALRRDHGKAHDKAKMKGSPFEFSRYGKSGKWVSELLPNVAESVDDLCFIHSIFNESGGHSKATLSMHTGSVTLPMPSLGAWVGYGLGTQNPNLPPFVVFAKVEPYNAHICWGSDFLPAHYRGLRIVPPEAIPNVKSPVESATRLDLERLMLKDVNEGHLAAHPDDLNLRSRMTNFETAYGLMREAPEAFDLAGETDETLALYGTERGDRSSLGAQCLTARRLLERGVRVVELFDVGSHDNWDHHDDIHKHRELSRRLDRPLGAFLKDLKRRGLLDDTLVVGMGEFGRTPWTDLTPEGRGHHAEAFTVFLAGGGVKGGFSYGSTDEYGATVVENRVHVHDFHATILHLLGLDHTRLTYRYSGRDFRLTDLGGNVIKGILA
ncbi:MAG TPA: DUF1501 domain-containing protein [Planctomycetota bacterium]|nr:DUF1501 domain-containing protein [Planctomycetota bacterium]